MVFKLARTGKSDTQLRKNELKFVLFTQKLYAKEKKSQFGKFKIGTINDIKSFWKVIRLKST